MSILRHASGLRPIHAAAPTLQRVAHEVVTLLDACMFPGRIIAEVQEMRRLHDEARRVEGFDPARAATLRQRAARLGLD